MIDLEKLVLTPASRIYQLAISYTPTVSQPGMSAFDTYGVYSSDALDVQLQDEATYSDQQTKLGIRLADFAVDPAEGDELTITQTNHRMYGKQYWVGDLDEDGQGGGTLMLRLKEPPS
jgi:hypothetical protein